jgi:hypothetical protein
MDVGQMEVHIARTGVTRSGKGKIGIGSESYSWLRARPSNVHCYGPAGSGVGCGGPGTAGAKSGRSTAAEPGAKGGFTGFLTSLRNCWILSHSQNARGDSHADRGTRGGFVPSGK